MMREIELEVFKCELLFKNNIIVFFKVDKVVL